jgi:hypothetical protein
MTKGWAQTCYSHQGNIRIKEFVNHSSRTLFIERHISSFFGRNVAPSR